MPLESINLSAPKGGKSDFQATPEEIRTIQEKMKDPEFMKLMTEYMTSLEDPAYRKEEEEYLAQVEREAKEGGDNSFDFVFPKPSYFVELLQGVGKDKEGARVFINMCTSEKIEEYQEQSTNDRNASNWVVPVSIGRPRPDTFEGKACCVYDAAFHPKTLALGDRSDRFMTFLVEIAVENINAGHKKQYGYGYRRMSSSTSSVISVGIPQNMTVKRAAGSNSKSIFDMAKEQSVLAGPTKFGKDGTAKLNEASAAAAAGGGTSGYTPSGAASSTTVSANSGASRVPPAATTSEAASSAATAKKPAAAAPPADNLPPYTITHRGTVDLTDTWNWKVSDKRTGVPKQLVVTATFSGVTSAAHLEMDVSADGSRIDIHKTDKHPFYGSIVLPFSVEETPSSAKFDKKKCVLTLVLDVCNTVIPKENLPTLQSSDAKEERKEEEDEEPSPKQVVEDSRTVVGNTDEDDAKKGTPVDVQSALPSMSPTRGELPSASSAAASPNKAEKEENEKEENETKNMKEEKKQPLVEEMPSVPTASLSTSIIKDADEKKKNKDNNKSHDDGNKAEKEGFEPDANDRMKEVMRRIAEAKQQREEAERIEREAELAVKEAEEEEARKNKAQQEAAAAKKAAAADETAAEASATAEPSPNVASSSEEPLEVIDLRNRQAEWLKGVTNASPSGDDTNANNGSIAEDSKKTVSFDDAIKEAASNVKKDTMGGLLEELMRDDEEDEEDIAKKKEMKRKLREIQKQEDAAKEAERLERLLKEKMATLPLQSRYIFDIE